MATTPATRTRSTNAKRSANAKTEPRDEDGRFTTESNPSPRTPRKKAPRADTSATTGQMLAAGAAGLAVGLAANVARKLAVQSPTYFAGEWDEALKTEHELTLKVFDQIEATTEKNTTKRSMLLANLKHMLTKHALEEENAIYAAMRDAGEAEAADHLNNDHGYVKQYLYDLTLMPKDSPSWIAKVRQFRADITKHMREEETTLFPLLKGKLSAEKNKELTATMNKEGLKVA